jgi:hypothetical protein
MRPAKRSSPSCSASRFATARRYPSPNIVQNAVDSKEHATLDAPARIAGLVDTLVTALGHRQDEDDDGRHEINTWAAASCGRR